MSAWYEHVRTPRFCGNDKLLNNHPRDPISPNLVDIPRGVQSDRQGCRSAPPCRIAWQLRFWQADCPSETMATVLFVFGPCGTRSFWWFQREANRTTTILGVPQKRSIRKACREASANLALQCHEHVASLVSRSH